ncbi:hypothetical protein ACULLB_07875 [Enterococcus gallinarum]|uniref:hypothetical protein n=1 Tax=Enterococcus gallinarum TaxID=1353 RepID=UPI0010FF715E|nr:hypothetical protein [Enterococcus gallinarum]QCT92558.1 hypothetical protein FE005_11745 [Enterococcus sp. M190262]GMG59984.1 hypothetical protein AH4_33350 [Enterococcus gallinarum]
MSQREHQAVYILDVLELDIQTKEIIKSSINEISRGAKRGKKELMSIVIKDLLNFLERQDENKVKGTVAEFFIHLFLRSQDFEQHCCFMNLEENSMKKGFDGLYTREGETWIMESKSTAYKTSSGKHNQNLSKAYQGLKKSMRRSGNSGNNSWSNALNHTYIASNESDTTDSLRDKLLSASNKYVNNVELDLGEYNIIPCSTIFIEDYSGEIYESSHDEIFQSVNKHVCNKEVVLCVMNRSVNIFIECLEELLCELDGDANEKQ